VTPANAGAAGTMAADKAGEPEAARPSLPLVHAGGDAARHRPFFLTALAVTLTAGATWGAAILWQIGLAGSFTGVGIGHVNAHGHAQILGWVGLFVLGFGYRAFPRFWNADLAAPRLVRPVLAAMLAGIALHVAGAVGPWAGAAAASAAGPGLAALLVGLAGVLETAAVTAFAAQMAATWRRGTRGANRAPGQARLDPATAFILVATGWLVLQTAMAGWHHWQVHTAPDREALLAQVATWQAVLRDLQIHGLALTMILGVSQRILPGMLGVRRTPARRAWWALGLLTAAVVGESVLFVAYRATGQHALAAGLLLPWLLLPAAAWLVAGPWRLWRPAPTPHRSARFVRAAYAWLAISLAGLVLLPVYTLISGLDFSHAYYGAVRHAITVGFVSQMIVGVGAWAAARFAGADRPDLPALRPTFVLLNLGCALRVSLQTATDWHPAFFGLVGISGLLEITALALWGRHLVQLLAGRREGSPARSLLASTRHRKGAPCSTASCG